jgi:hypothetical protein
MMAQQFSVNHIHSITGLFSGNTIPVILVPAKNILKRPFSGYQKRLLFDEKRRF